MAEPIYGRGYEAVYMGSYGPLEPEYGELFTGYRVPFGRVAAPTSPQTANQLGEVSARLSEGIRSVELQPLSPLVFETIPKEHIKEIERLGKLTGADFSLHAPLIDPAGFSQEGRWSEVSRAESETRLKNVIDRAHELSPKGNIPIALHSTIGIPSTTWKPSKERPEVQTLAIVDRETGALTGVEREMRYFPEEVEITPERALEMKNTTDWDRYTLPLVDYEKEANRLVKESWPIVAPRWQEMSKEQTEIIRRYNAGEINERQAGEMIKKATEKIEPELQPFFNQVQMSQNYYREISKHLETFYDKAYKYAKEEGNKKMMREIEAKAQEYKKARELAERNPAMASAAFHPLIEGIRSPKFQPETYVTAEKFALKHSKDTIAGAALYGFKKYGDNAPIIAVENFYPGTVFSTGEELAKLINASRNEFVKKAKATGYSESEAREAAEKLIGATWDVGHMNLIRKFGFPKKKVVEETKKIAPFVKHVHITDNFGFEDSHLPPGMGEVPIKEMLKELEKAGFKGKEVMEAGGWVAQFKTSPTPYILEALGSPLYAAYMQPFWNQVRGMYGIPAGYSAGYGMMLPEQHFGTYGSGFSGLPMELGGQMPGKGQRFTGAPME